MQFIIGRILWKNLEMGQAKEARQKKEYVQCESIYVKFRN